MNCFGDLTGAEHIGLDGEPQRAALFYNNDLENVYMTEWMNIKGRHRESQKF